MKKVLTYLGLLVLFAVLLVPTHLVVDLGVKRWWVTAIIALGLALAVITAAAITARRRGKS